MTSGLSGRRILLVEDEIMVAWALEDMLDKLGCVVVGPAARVDQALELIGSADFDAAVLDVNLNGEESYPVADALTARGVPFLFSTGYNKGNLREAYRPLPLLQKPYERSVLGDQLADLLALGETAAEAPAANLVWDANRLRTATDAAGVGLWSWNIDADEFTMDERSHKLWGVSRGPITFEDLSSRIHPDDILKVRDAFTKARKVVGAYEADFRILHSGEIRWVSARGMGANLGAVGRVMFGVFLDISERRKAEEAREMLATEMGHRVKNLFAIARALTKISARSTTTSAEMSLDLSRRLDALNKAHELVQPGRSPSGSGQAVPLDDLLRVLLSPYDGESCRNGRISVAAAGLVAGEASTTTMALIVHELATNSLKYGSLSAAAGTVAVACHAEGGSVTMTWTERGGPPVTAPKEDMGFGSQLVAKSASGQLGGSIAYDWSPGGVIVTLRMRQSSLEA